MNSRKRTLIAPIEIAGYFSRLQEGIVNLGEACDYVTFQRNKFSYDLDKSRPLLVRIGVSWNESAKKVISKLDLGRFAQRLAILPGSVLIYSWAFYAIFRYDRFIFGFGLSLLPNNSDLPIIRALGKQSISVIGLGSDTRAPYLNGALKSRNSGQMPNPRFLNTETQRIVTMIRKHEKWADHIVGFEGSSAILSNRRQIRLHELGIPHPLLGFQQNNVSVKSDLRRESKIKIVHAPSRKFGKGTVEIINVVEVAEASGIPIEFRLLTGLSNAQLMTELAQADLLIDEIYSDTPMATLSTEAALLGVPAIVGGYRLSETLSSLPEHRRPPVIVCEPKELLETVIAACSDASELADLGKRAREYVQRELNPDRVAERYLRLFENDFPDSWLFDPNKDYLIRTFGLESEEAKQCLRDTLLLFGPEGLGINNKLKRDHLLREFGL